MIRERPALANRDASVKTFPEWQKDNLGLRLNPTTHGAARRDVTVSRRASEEEECARLSLFLTLLPSGETLHLIRWWEFFPTFHVGLNFHSYHSTSELPPKWAHLGCHNMGFEILGKTETTHGPLVVHQMGQYFSNLPPGLKSPFRDTPNLSACLDTNVSADC